MIGVTVFTNLYEMLMINNGSHMVFNNKKVHLFLYTLVHSHRICMAINTDSMKDGSHNYFAFPRSRCLLKDSNSIGIFYCFSTFGTILNIIIITDREVLGQYCYWSGRRGFFFHPCN